MPYIKPQYRSDLDPFIDALAAQIKILVVQEKGGETSYAGLLNYAITTLAMKVINLQGGIRYGTIATITGVLSNVSSEFYRRVVQPYENEQIDKSGDISVYEYSVFEDDK